MININSYKSKSNESKSTFEMTFNSTFITNKSKIQERQLLSSRKSVLQDLH